MSKPSLMDKIREEYDERNKKLQNSLIRIQKIQSKEYVEGLKHGFNLNTPNEHTNKTELSNTPFEHTNRTIFLNTPKKLQKWREIKDKQGEVLANRTCLLNIPLEHINQTYPLNISNEQFNRAVQPDSSNEQSVQLDSLNKPFNQTHPLNTPFEHTKRTGEMDTSKEEEQENFERLINDSPSTRFTKNQQIVYGFLLNNPQIITSYNYLEKVLNIPVQTLRHILRKFEKLEIINKSKYCGPDNVQGLKIQLLKNLEQFNRTHSLNTHLERFNRTVQDASIKKDRKNISLSKKESGEDQTEGEAKKKLLDLTDQDIGFFWPNLYSSGFSTKQIEQIINCLEKINKKPTHIFESLNYAEYELENNLMTDKNGKKVADPNSFLFRSLAKNGYYRQPKGYISPERQALMDAKEEAEKIIKEKEEKEKAEKEAKFEKWKDNLTEEEKEKLKEKSPNKTLKRTFLKSYWEKYVYKI